MKTKIFTGLISLLSILFLIGCQVEQTTEVIIEDTDDTEYITMQADLHAQDKRGPLTAVCIHMYKVFNICTSSL